MREMGIFGWSLPPGCGTLPGEEPGEAIELTARVKLRAPAVAVYWDEDGNLIECFPVDVPADEYARTPAYQEMQNAKVGTREWDDDATEEENIEAAAHAYNLLTRLKKYRVRAEYPYTKYCRVDWEVEAATEGEAREKAYAGEADGTLNWDKSYEYSDGECGDTEIILVEEIIDA
jgi:hypothetical protein